MTQEGHQTVFHVSFAFVVSSESSSVVDTYSLLGLSDLIVEQAMAEEQAMVGIQMMAEEQMMVEEQTLAEEQTMAVDREALEVPVADDAHETTLDMK